MTRRRLIAGVVLVIAAGLGGYAATVATRSASAPAPAADSATQALLDWLNASAVQRAALRDHDRSFPGELQKLRSELATRRAELAAALEKTGTPDDVIMSRVEAVSAASAALDRRVAGYLLSVRDHLNAEQQKRLFGLCAETVREGGGRQWRGGRGVGAEGNREGRGGGGGRGRGPGWGGGRGGPGGPGHGGGWGRQQGETPASGPASALP